MYKLPYFQEEDRDKVIAFMKANPFAVVTGIGNEYPVAYHSAVTKQWGPLNTTNTFSFFSNAL